MNTQIVVCHPECRGTGDLCLFEIAQIAKSGKAAFMIHSHHVEEKVRRLGYAVTITYQNDIPIGMYVYEKSLP